METENWDDGDMGAFGDKLRREREMRGVTLGEISESTKISVGFLRALEQEDHEKLPGGVFNRGFIRAYCKFLGVEEDGMVADFDVAYEQHRAAQAPVAPPVQVAPPEGSPKLPHLAILLSIPLALIVGGSIWWYSQSKSTEEANTLNTHSESNSSANAANLAPSQPMPNPSLESMEQKKEQANKTAAPAKEPVQTGKIEKKSGAEVTSGTATTAPEIVSKSATKSIRLEVRTREQAWLSIVADGKTLMEGVMPAEKSKTFRAKRNMVLTTGNAGGVQVSYNGKALPPLGSLNEVKSLTFTPDGPQQ